MATLINGNLNSPIYAAQDADLLAAICGNTTCVTPVGEQFAETLEDANTIMVADGVIITKEGRRIQIDAGDIDEFLIPTGTQGQTQYFICGYHLYTDEDSAELCETFVEPVDSASEVITENTFRGGATEVYVSLLRVKQVGVQIDTITRLLPSSTTISQINTALSDLSDVLNDPTFNYQDLTFTNCVLSSGGYVEFGKLVVINIRISANSTAQNKHITGLPTYSGNANRVVLSCIDYVDNSIVPCTLSKDGDLTVGTTTTNGYIISGCYVKA